MSSLIPFEQFEQVFGPLTGREVSFHWGAGNAGDRLIHAATRQLFIKYGISISYDREQVILYGGGGNMGNRYPSTRAVRAALEKRAEELNIPLIILPQSWSSFDDTTFTRAYARERYSLQYCPDAIIAPDLALGYTPDFKFPRATENVGRFFREDQERVVNAPKGNLGDPVKWLSSHRDYLVLAARYKEIHTDRLHLAICGLIARRKVVLYPNSYHKNKGVWEAWLQALGCYFSG